MLRVNQQYGFGILTFAKESRALIDAMTVRPNLSRCRLIDLTIRALLGSGVWQKLDVMWVLAAHDEQAGRLNWKSPGDFTVSAVNAWTFTTDRGFAGDVVSGYGDTGWDMATNAVQATQNSTTAFLYNHTANGNNTSDFGPQTSQSIYVRHRNGTNDEVRINGNTALLATAGGSTVPNLLFGRRSSSTSIEIGRDGVQVNSGASTSGALSNSDLGIGRSSSQFSNARVSLAGIAAYLDDTEMAAFYTAAHAYMVGVGVDT